MKKLLIFLLIASSQNIFAGDVTIIDAQHYSVVFGETRNYRIFLPSSYAENSGRRFPVIYFMHGWSQRYFGSGADDYAGFDKGKQNNGDNIANFVKDHEVIVVKSDGYNRRPDEEYYLRPYNVSPVETFRQFPIYFEELVNYIDANYRTIANREHRAISGLSMGGFMTFWIAGKYPHLFSAAGNFCGSPEFEVGPRNFPVEYRHIDMYKNYGGVNLRLHYGDKDFIRGYHHDMNRAWPYIMDNYQWKVYDAEHSTCGLSDMFAFLMNNFEHPLAKPAQWSHTDVYPDFTVWNYHVRTDRNVPGFTVLENVDKKGFRCAVREFVPDGSLIPSVNLNVITAPVYEKNQEYTVNDIELSTRKTKTITLKSDNEGKLSISINGALHEIGINKKTDGPELRIASIQVQNASWLTLNKDAEITIDLVNKGILPAKNVSAQLSATRNTALIAQGKTNFQVVNPNQVAASKNALKFKVVGDSIDMVQLRLDIKDDKGNTWVQYFELPVEKQTSEIKDFVIADGKEFTVASGGNKTTTEKLGKGNGDGIANPGEHIVILVKDSGKYQLTDLRFSNPYINPYGINNRKSDNWTYFDYVGGSAKYDVPLIAAECPENEEIPFHVTWWIAEYPYHIIKNGWVNIKVRGKDQTPPIIDTFWVSADNVFLAKIIDGSPLRDAKVKLINAKDASRTIELELKDDGTGSDRAAGDHMFSAKIAEQKFDFYRSEIQTADSAGNKATTRSDRPLVVH